MQRSLGVPIVWLEWRDFNTHGVRYERISHNSAARTGEPFKELVRKRRMLPNRVARFCTAELKVHTNTRYCRDQLGWKKWAVARGLRADEPDRLKGKPIKERWTPWHPLADAGVTRRDVAAFWQDQPFDLRLENINGKTPHGNCDGCFLKSEANLAALARDHPERAQWWADLEATCGVQIGKESGAFFNQRRPMQTVIDVVNDMGRGFSVTRLISAKLMVGTVFDAAKAARRLSGRADDRTAGARPIRSSAERRFRHGAAIDAGIYAGQHSRADL